MITFQGSPPRYNTAGIWWYRALTLILSNMATLKYEARTKDPVNHTYGVWNNDMQAWQYIARWGCNETLDLEKANKTANRLNLANCMRTY